MSWTAFRRAAFMMVMSGLVLGACQATHTVSPAPVPAAAAATEPTTPVTPWTGRNLANNCFTCHGPGGRSPGTIPSIYALSAEAIAERLYKFRSGVVPSTVMGRLAKGYTDAEIEAVAKHIAELHK